MTDQKIPPNEVNVEQAKALGLAVIKICELCVKQCEHCLTCNKCLWCAFFDHFCIDCQRCLDDQDHKFCDQCDQCTTYDVVHIHCNNRTCENMVSSDDVDSYYEICEDCRNHIVKSTGKCPNCNMDDFDWENSKYVCINCG